jgi:hypothetical protein
MHATGPEVLKMLSELFDEVWASVASDFRHDPAEIEAGRIRLATIILDLAKDGQLGPSKLHVRPVGSFAREKPIAK